METKPMERFGDEYQLILGEREIYGIFDDVGIPYDRNELVDSYHSLLVLIEDHEYQEIWGAHSAVPRDRLPYYLLAQR